MEIQTLVRMRSTDKAKTGLKDGAEKEFHPVDAREHFARGGWEIIGDDKFHVGNKKPQPVAEPEETPAVGGEAGGSIAGAGQKNK